MDEVRENSLAARVAPLWDAMRPAVPAVIGAVAVAFLFAAIMPMTWVAAISWQLYLDRLSDLFVPPIGNGARLALAVGMAIIAALIAGLVALVLTKPHRGVRRPRRAAGDILRRRRADAHPDDAPRPPIHAGRDLPAGGLGPIGGGVAANEDDPDDAAFDLTDLAPAAADGDEELILADLAPVDYDPDGDDAPWLQPAEIARAVAPAAPAAADASLGAMVARFEAGLARRRLAAAEAPGAPDADAADAEPEIDFALEAALSTLQRMTRRAVG